VTRRIYVGNLPYSVDNAQLAHLFRRFGEVVYALVVTDRASDRSKGYGFIEMASDEAARQAITELHGTTLGDRRLMVNEARPRLDRRPDDQR
jgi:RNA recognition motif-containing protein